jgi:ADP-ribosylglycohydrolase/protein-tyrosine phosphatase
MMAKTSTTDPLRIDEVALGNGGVLGLTLCPGKKQPLAMTGAWDRDLATDLRVIADWGAGAVVTLMEVHELHRLQVAHIGEAVETLGMDWYLLPISDGNVPDGGFERVWSYAGCRLRSLLASGKKLLFHCRGGLGRTGTIAARLLVEVGSSPEGAIARVREARPGTIENDAQERYVRNLTLIAVPDSLATRILGCVLGGAIGDAFGYEVEFNSLSAIRARFGSDGIRQPVFHHDLLVVSDDTQMSLFTAEGLLRALRGQDGAGVDAVVGEIRAAYLDWLLSQGSSWCGWQPRGRLARAPTLGHRRAPGNTCLSALLAGGRGTIESKINDSKGCGGVMRTAPIGLVTAWDARHAFDVGARASAITHGHPSGYLSGGAMAAMVRLLIGGASLEEAAERAVELAAAWSGSGEIIMAIRNALDLACTGSKSHDRTIRPLGEGWVGGEALAIGLYAALVGSSFVELLAIAANHDGDSDSTASIAGQLYGAWKGVSEIPHGWVRRIDVIEPLYEVTHHLISANRSTPTLAPR